MAIYGWEKFYFLNEIEIYEKKLATLGNILSRFTIILELLSDIYKVILAVVSCLMIVSETALSFVQ